ncbi:MAG: hypothetical protein NVS2B7_41070 [Herpetosiphon sp.]
MGAFGNFVGGLVVGAAVGAGVIVFTTPRTGDETRSRLTGIWNNAVSTGKEAADAREAELWADFNTRVKEGDTAITKA